MVTRCLHWLLQDLARRNQVLCNVQIRISKTLNNVWQALQEESLAALEKVTLAELCDSVSNSEEKKKSKIADFTI